MRFILFCEGRNTEPAYFAAIGRKWTGTLVEIKTHGGVGVPMTVAQRAVDFAKAEGLTGKSRRRRSSFENRDPVWAVFDRDEHSKYEESVHRCEAEGIGVARSNPCFEVWKILHEQDYIRPDDRHQVQSVLQGLRPQYERGRAKLPNCEEMVERVKYAEERGEELCRRREYEGDPHGRPSTTVGKLTKAIREADSRVRRTD